MGNVQTFCLLVTGQGFGEVFFDDAGHILVVVVEDAVVRVGHRHLGLHLRLVIGLIYSRAARKSDDKQLSGRLAITGFLYPGDDSPDGEMMRCLKPRTDSWLEN